MAKRFVDGYETQQQMSQEYVFIYALFSISESASFQVCNDCWRDKLYKTYKSVLLKFLLHCSAKHNYLESIMMFFVRIKMNSIDPWGEIEPRHLQRKDKITINITFWGVLNSKCWPDNSTHIWLNFQMLIDLHAVFFIFFTPQCKSTKGKCANTEECHIKGKTWISELSNTMNANSSIQGTRAQHLNPVVHLREMSDSTLHQHNQNTKYGNIFRKNCVHPSCKHPSLCITA